MATLKMTSNGGGLTWLPNVRRVEQMAYFDGSFIKKVVETPHTDGFDCIKEPWDLVSGFLPLVLENYPKNHQAVVRSNLENYDNYYAALSIIPGVSYILLHTVLDIGDGVRCQNWLVEHGSNYLLENGKTIDRI